MKKVYAFDFDGTLTTHDTLLLFIRFVKGRSGLLWCLLKYSPLLLLMKLGLYANWKVKQQVFTHCFGGWLEADFDACCVRFATCFRHVLRPNELEIIERAKAEGSEVVIVSASVDRWVQPFFPMVKVACTQVEVAEGRLTGRFQTANCYGQEKVRRLLELYPDRKDYQLISFGDSRGDRELLAFADEAYFKGHKVKG